MTSRPVALLIDAENIPVRCLPRILAITEGIGTPIVRRVFGDFSHARLAEWQQQAAAAGFSVDHEPSTGAGKNTTDIRLTIAALDIAAAGMVAGFCVASSDRDFSPLLRRLREGGFEVHAISEEKAGSGLRSSATRFHALQTAAPKPLPQLGPRARIDALDRAERDNVAGLLAKLCDANGRVSLPVVGKALRENYPALAGKLGGSGLGKRLRALNAVSEVCSDGTVVLPPARKKPVQQPGRETLPPFFQSIKAG